VVDNKSEPTEATTSPVDDKGELVDGRTDTSDRSGTSAERSGTGFFAVMQSVGAAMIGVQSSKNKERDFTQGKPLHFILGGLLGTLIFLLCIWMLVKYLIATS